MSGIAPREALFQRPVHPYTRGLLAAMRRTDPRSRLHLRALMDGKVSDPLAWPEAFRSDGSERLDFIDLGDGHMVRAQQSLLTETRV
ncbi:MAG: hypothetical protein ACE5K1_05275 [Acidiferrobacterales bacterium]